MLFSDGESEGGEDDTSDSDFEPDKEGGNVRSRYRSAFLICDNLLSFCMCSLKLTSYSPGLFLGNRSKY